MSASHPALVLPRLNVAATAGGGRSQAMMGRAEAVVGPFSLSASEGVDAASGSEGAGANVKALVKQLTRDQLEGLVLRKVATGKALTCIDLANAHPSHSQRGKAAERAVSDTPDGALI